MKIEIEKIEYERLKKIEQIAGEVYPLRDFAIPSIQADDPLILQKTIRKFDLWLLPGEEREKSENNCH